MELIDKSAVVAEIERRKNQIVSQAESFRKIGKEDKESYFAALASNMNSLSCFIDTIEVKEVGEPSKDLEEAASQYSFNIPSAIFNDLTHVLQNIWKREIEGAFIAGAKLQEEQIMKNAVEREVKEDAGGYPFIEATELYDYDNDKPLAKAGDKIKVLIVKE